MCLYLHEENTSQAAEFITEKPLQQVQRNAGESGISVIQPRQNE